MNATDIKYHPFRAAAQAAFSELSSDSAHRYYSLKAQKDVQNVLDPSITLYAWIYQLAELTYMMGLQCRAWCDALETNAQASARPVLLLAPAQVEDTEDLWEVEADYELVEFSPSAAAQAFISPLLMLYPASTIICGLVWNPAPGRDMHTEVERLLELQHVPLMLAAAPETAMQSTTEQIPAVDEFVSALEVPGATGGKQRKPKATAGSKAAAKPKQTKARAKTGARAGVK